MAALPEQERRLVVVDPEPAARHLLAELFAPHFRVMLRSSLPSWEQCESASVLILSTSIAQRQRVNEIRQRISGLPVFLYTDILEESELEDEPPRFALSLLRDEEGRARLLLAVDRSVRARPRHTSSSLEPVGNAGRANLLIGCSESCARLREAVDHAAHSRLNLLLTGETGVGKSHVAQIVHAAPGDVQRPLVVSEPAALATTLFESGLFGHVRGAFTGATTSYIGAFEAACGGTLFLDEIAEIPLGLQVKLLRAVENKVIRRLGSTQDTPLDLRIITATNQDLSQRVAAGQFRADLYHRLNELHIHITPLRERKADLLPLLSHFLAQAGAPGLELSPSAIERLTAYDWPGNSREVRSLARRLADRQVADRVDDGDLIAAMPVLTHTHQRTFVAASADSGPEERVRQFRRMLYMHELEKTNFNIREAAKCLGLPYGTLRSRLNSMGLIDELRHP